MEAAIAAETPHGPTIRRNPDEAITLRRRARCHARLRAPSQDPPPHAMTLVAVTSGPAGVTSGQFGALFERTGSADRRIDHRAKTLRRAG